MILCVGTTPAVQRVMVFRQLALDGVNRAVTTVDGAAGKSVNVAKVLQVLGANPLATGFIGGDRGNFLRTELTARAVAHDFVSVARPTRQCITVIDDSLRTCTELVEESRPVSPHHFEKLFEKIKQHLLKCRAVVMSGTITPGGPRDFYFQVARMAHEVGALSVVDAQGDALTEAIKARPTVMKPNRSELAATVGRELKNEAALMAAMRELHQHGAQRVVVTGGKDRVFAFDGKVFWRISVPQIAVVNPIGSGDAFTAGLVWRLVQGEQLHEACRWACAAGAANALTLMPGEVIRADIDRMVTAVKCENV